MDVFLKSMISIHLKNIYMYVCMYVWLCWVFIAVPMLSLVVDSGGCFVVTVHGLLIVEASLVVEHRL